MGCDFDPVFCPFVIKQILLYTGTSLFWYIPWHFVKSVAVWVFPCLKNLNEAKPSENMSFFGLTFNVRLDFVIFSLLIMSMRRLDCP